MANSHNEILVNNTYVHRIHGVLLWSVLGVGLLGLSGCFGSLKEAQQQALKAETTLHDQMTRGDLAGIYNGADQRYRDAVTREKSDALFSSIVRKLGAPQVCDPGGVNIQVGTWGTTIRSECKTKFSKAATGLETFSWAKSGNDLRLLGYHINSNELIER